MSSTRIGTVFRAAAMAVSVAALALPARADDLLATLSLDMSPDTAWPIATDHPVQTADASTSGTTGSVIPPANAAQPATPETAAAQPAPAPANPNPNPSPAGAQQTAQTPAPAAPAQPGQA